MLRRGDGEIDVHGIGLVHVGQQGVVADQVAGREAFLGAVPGHGGHHLAVVQIDLGGTQGSLGVVIGGLGVVAILLGDGVLGEQGAHAVPLALGAVVLGLGLLDGGLVLVALDLEHELTGLDELAFTVQTLLDDALHTGTHFDGPGAGGLGLEFGRPGHVLGFHLEDAHRRGGHLAFLSTFILACRKAETEKQQQRCQNGLFSGHDILLLGQQRTADTWKARPQSERALNPLLNIFCKMRQEMQAYLALKVQ